MAASDKSDIGLIANPKAGVVVLACDLQNDIVARSCADDEQRTACTAAACAVLESARAAKVPIGHVVVRFRSGYPEIPPADESGHGIGEHKLFSSIRKGGILVEGSEGAAQVDECAAKDGEPVFVKRRVGAVESTDLLRWLRSTGAWCVVLLGHSTSGVVLSTYTALADLDFRVIVVKDACSDANEARHDALCDMVFPMQGHVTDSGAVVGQLKGRGAT